VNIETYREYCLSKPGVTESFPFNDTTLVFKVVGKVFALAGIENFRQINLKCDPEKAIELRADYNGVIPGFHMNKKHWNTVSIFEDLPTKLIFELIDHSYNLVVLSLTKKAQNELRAKEGK
jgi:predicted DNA-binding protein (MmcQ/YjbR family)